MIITRMFPKVPALVSAAAVACFLSSSSASGAITWLFDFGAAGTTTTNGAAPADDPVNFWNNVPDTIGTSDTGALFDVVTTTNTATDVDLLMIRRFNGSNTNGTLNSTVYLPDDATRDSLYGNTEFFGTLENVFPSFKFSSLTIGQSYDFRFYASRTGVSDNRTTDYTVVGANGGVVSLNVANNIDNFVTLSGIFPDASGEITISLSPNAANNNSNHFTYLGVLEMQMVPEPGSAILLVAGTAIALAKRRRFAA